MEWRALHLYIHDITCHNTFLTEYLKPEIDSMESNSLLEQFFFIVYWQGGNHIRFRYKSNNYDLVETRIKQCFDKFAEKYEPVYVLDEATYYSLYENNKEQVTNLQLVKDKTMMLMQYEPEIERYGGVLCMPHNETLFSLSSKYALQIRQEAGMSMIKRIIGALDMFAVAIKMVEDKDAFLWLYRKYWLEFAPSNKNGTLSVENIASKYKKRYLDLMQCTHSYYAEWEKTLKQEMKEICSVQTSYPNAETAFAMVLSSQIHMTNNRLGVFPQMEAALAEVLYLCGRS